jgi:hypothetical protein
MVKKKLEIHQILLMILELLRSIGQSRITYFLCTIWLLTGQGLQRRWLATLSWQSTSQSKMEEARASLTWYCPIALVKLKDGARIGTDWYTYNARRRHAARRWTYAQRFHLNAILAIKAVDSTIPHAQVQRRTREHDTVPAAVVTDSASSRLT